MSSVSTWLRCAKLRTDDMHNAAFEHFSIDGAYELREMEPDQILGFVAEARRDEWLGFQVTAPYKQIIMAHLDEIEDGSRPLAGERC